MAAALGTALVGTTPLNDRVAVYGTGGVLMAVGLALAGYGLMTVWGIFVLAWLLGIVLLAIGDAP